MISPEASRVSGLIRMGLNPKSQVDLTRPDSSRRASPEIQAAIATIVRRFGYIDHHFETKWVACNG
jgi:hypothetical protein